VPIGLPEPEHAVEASEAIAVVRSVVAHCAESDNLRQESRREAAAKGF
jgi:hypothetical protein